MAKIYNMADYRREPFKMAPWMEELAKHEHNPGLLNALGMALEAEQYNGGEGPGRPTLKKPNATSYSRPGDKGKERKP